MDNNYFYKRWDQVKFKGDHVNYPIPQTYIWSFVPGDGENKLPYHVIEHPNGQDKQYLVSSQKVEDRINPVPEKDLKEGIKYVRVFSGLNGENSCFELIRPYIDPLAVVQEARTKVDTKKYLFRVLNKEGVSVFNTYDEKQAEDEFIKYAFKQGGNYYMFMLIEISEVVAKYIYSQKQDKFLKQ